MWCGVVCVVLVTVCGGLSVAAQAVSEPGDWWDSGLTVVQRSLQECEVAKDVSSCLKVKAVRALDRALHTGGITNRIQDRKRSFICEKSLDVKVSGKITLGLSLKAPNVLAFTIVQTYCN